LRGDRQRSSKLPRKNCWTISEYVRAKPDGLRHPLARVVWNAEAGRQDLRGYVVEHLGQTGAALAMDERPRGCEEDERTVGVQRRYTCTAGRIRTRRSRANLTYATET
jgi:SRSO17 transposase